MNRPRPRPQGLLIDMDGVLRVYDEAWNLTVEERHGLPPGSLAATAFAPDRCTPAITGLASHAEWIAGVGEALGAPEAAAEWQSYHGDIVPAVRDLVAELRAAQIPVALASNATDRLGADLASFGLTDAFDAVVNASEIGFAKPHPEFFARACALLGVPARDTLLLDDSARHVAGARAAGLLAYRYESERDLPYIRAAFTTP